MASHGSKVANGPPAASHSRLARMQRPVSAIQRGAWPLGFLALGLVQVFWPMLRSGFDLVPGDLGDARFVNFVLEHDYRWATRDPRHRDLWNTPALFPLPNTLAFSDGLLGVAPIYGLWRAGGVEPHTALQLWILTCSVLNYAAFALFARRCGGLGVFASSLAAFVFAFGNARVNQLNHLQLLPHFYTVLALYALVRLFDDSSSTLRRECMWLVVAVAAIVAQLYAGFYFGWFLLFALGVATGWAVLRRSDRGRLLALLRRQALAVVSTGLMAALAVLPLVLHSRDAAQVLPSTPFWQMADWLPRWQSWFFTGPHNWLYGWTAARWPFAGLPAGGAGEQVLGLGPITTIVGLGGLLAHRRRSGIRLMLLTGGSIVLVSTAALGGIAVWRAVYELVPGAIGIRTVARIGLLGLIPIALGVGFAAERAHRFGRTALALVIAAVVIAEQHSTYYSWNKHATTAEVQAVAARIDPGCAAFFSTPTGSFRPFPASGWYRYQLDAMWASLATGIPTINGYPPNPPAGWGFIDPVVRDAADAARLTAALATWLAAHPIEGRVCRVYPPKP